jgi:hypothetical protein
MPVIGKKDEPVEIEDLPNKEEPTKKLKEKTVKKDEEQPKLPVRDIATMKLGNKAVESLGNEFMVCNAGAITFETSITHNNIFYVPRQQSPYEPYSRSEELAKPDVQKLYDDVYLVVNDFLDIPDDYKHLIATAIFFTYQQHKSHTTPYLYIVGEKDSGKSRVLEIFEFLAYRPLLATSISAPNVIQYLEDGPVGIVLDDEVADSIKYDPDKRSIYKSGYRVSGKVPKIITDRDGRRKQIYFNAYAFKTFGSKHLVDDDQIVSRCIVISMIQGKPKYGGFLLDVDLPRFQKIKNKLLLWRLYTYLENYMPERPKTRIDELFLPLLKTAKFIGNDEAYEAVIRIRDQDKIEREEETRSTLEAKILITLVKLNQEKKDCTFSFKEIFNKLCGVTNGIVDEKKIKTGEFGEISMTLLGRRLKDIFKGKSKQKWYSGEYVQCYTFDKERLEKSIDVYHIRTEDLK